jgi:hypothetical protein
LLAWDVSKFDAPRRLTSFIFILGGCRWHILQQSLSPRREILIPLPKLLENPEKVYPSSAKNWLVKNQPFTFYQGIPQPVPIFLVELLKPPAKQNDYTVLVAKFKQAVKPSNISGISQCK